MSDTTMELHREQISARARTIRPGAVFLGLVTWLAMSIGWVAGTLAGWLWYLGAWVYAAAEHGAVTGWNTRPRVTAPPG